MILLIHIPWIQIYSVSAFHDYVQVNNMNSHSCYHKELWGTKKITSYKMIILLPSPSWKPYPPPPPAVNTIKTHKSTHTHTHTHTLIHACTHTHTHTHTHTNTHAHVRAHMHTRAHTDVSMCSNKWVSKFLWVFQALDTEVRGPKGDEPQHPCDRQFKYVTGNGAEADTHTTTISLETENHL